MKRGFTDLEQNKGKKVRLELVDLLSGAAFPFMLMLILSASILSFAASEDMTMNIVIIVVGEILLAAVFVIFGRQNGVVAYRKSVQQSKKREIGTNDIKTLLGIGEYSEYKGFIIGFISCVPYIVFQIINCIFPNTFCEFLLRYAFGWAYYPLNYSNVSEWLNLIWIIPATCIHALAYYIGAKMEKKNQDEMLMRQGDKDKKKKV